MKRAAFESDNVTSSSVRPLSQAGDQFKDLKRLGFVVSSWFGSFIYTSPVFRDTSLSMMVQGLKLVSTGYKHKLKHERIGSTTTLNLFILSSLGITSVSTSRTNNFVF